MLYYITGGERSGKGSYAQNIALQFSLSPIYLAILRVWDDNHQKRIDWHIEDMVGVIDYVTLWLTNFFVDTKNNIELSLSLAITEFNELLKINSYDHYYI